jgi:hypothetical protein
VSAERPAAATSACAKEIRWFKLAINTACPLRCDYCFIDKDSGEVMTPATARSAVDFMLASPGLVKQLFIYGGEPFLNFDLVEEITIYAERRAAEEGKELELAVCTSAVSVTKAQLDFLRAHRYFLSISIDGRQADHDRHRVLKGGQPTWERIARNLPGMLEAVGRERSMAIQCVHPDNVDAMLENFQALVGLGFQNIEIEIIHGFGWTAEQKERFGPRLKTVLDWIRTEALEGRDRFLGCSLGPILAWEAIQAEKDMCPFYCTTEVYPDGTYSFYPFPFVDDAGRRLSAVGHVETGIIPRFRDCRFDAKSDLCRGCTKDYYRDPTLNDGNEPYHVRTRMARAFMQEIALASRDDARLRRYFASAMRQRGIGTV